MPYSFSRLAFLFLFFALVGVPLVYPFAEAAFSAPPNFSSWNAGLFLRLFANILLLVIPSLSLAFLLGLPLALLLFRTDLPGRQWFLLAVTFSLFIPLGLQVSGWLSLLGRPWTTGLLPGIGIYTLASLPWVIWLAGSGLCGIEKELEEDGLLQFNSWKVIWLRTLPRCRGAILFAVLWLSFWIAGDVTVTDVLLIDTFAEEIHTRYTIGSEGSLTEVTLLLIPLILLAGLGIWTWAQRLKASPALVQWNRSPFPFSLGKLRRFWSFLLLLVFLGIFGFPVFSLIWRMGLVGHPGRFSGEHAWITFRTEWVLSAWPVFQNLLIALTLAGAISLVALLGCWLTEEKKAARGLLFFIAALAWVMPAPLVGIALKEVISLGVTWDPTGIWRRGFYDSYSVLPWCWAQGVRFLPLAIALHWSVVRMIPSELKDLAKLEGWSIGETFWRIVCPLAKPTWLAGTLAISALALGEVGASARVETPGTQIFALLLFNRMHYGVENNVAALGLVLFIQLSGFFLGGGLFWREVTKIMRAGRR